LAQSLAVGVARILQELINPALFWLGAHFPGTAQQGINGTPTMNELETISEGHLNRHVILIDDARCFDGKNDYPSLAVCRALTAQFLPTHKFTVEADIIRITPE
jgi:hypothetical protein